MHGMPCSYLSLAHVAHDIDSMIMVLLPTAAWAHKQLAHKIIGFSVQLLRLASSAGLLGRQM